MSCRMVRTNRSKRRLTYPERNTSKEVLKSGKLCTEINSDNSMRVPLVRMVKIQMVKRRKMKMQMKLLTMSSSNNLCSLMNRSRLLLNRRMPSDKSSSIRRMTRSPSKKDETLILPRTWRANLARIQMLSNQCTKKSKQAERRFSTASMNRTRKSRENRKRDHWQLKKGRSKWSRPRSMRQLDG